MKEEARTLFFVYRKNECRVCHSAHRTKRWGCAALPHTPISWLGRK